MSHDINTTLPTTMMPHVIPFGTPNPTALGTHGQLGRPAQMPTGNTPQTNELKASILQQFPGAQVTSEYRDPQTQAAIYAHAVAVHGADARAWAAPPGASSHNWGTALDVSPPRQQWQQFKATMRARGLRAYDEGTHIHVDDRTDLPNGPMEGR